MKFTETKLAGVYLIEPRRFEDERGVFVPSSKEFVARGMASVFVENNISYSNNRGTLRGMHYQAAPHGQAKLVRCTRGDSTSLERLKNLASGHRCSLRKA